MPETHDASKLDQNKYLQFAPLSHIDTLGTDARAPAQLFRRLTTGTYYWAVRSMDKAGNVGPVSVKRAFVLQ